MTYGTRGLGEFRFFWGIWALYEFRAQYVMRNAKLVNKYIDNGNILNYYMNKYIILDGNYEHKGK